MITNINQFKKVFESNNNIITLDTLVKYANAAEEIVLDAKDSILELGEIYGENIPLQTVLDVLVKYDITLDDILDIIEEKEDYDSITNEAVNNEEETDNKDDLDNLLYVGNFEI